MAEEERSHSAHLPAAEAQLRVQLAQLHAVATLAETLATSSNLDELYDAALDAFSLALRGDRLAILVNDAAGVARFVRWRGLSAAYRAAVEGHSFWAPDDAEPRTVVVPDVDTDLGLVRVLEAVRAEGIRALTAIPLRAKGQLVGKCMVYFEEPHTPAESDLRFAETIARHVAVAVERRRSEAALWRTNHLLRSIMEGTNNAVVAKDLAGRLLLANQAAARVAGVDHVGLEGLTVEELLRPDDAALSRARDREVFETGQPVTYDQTLTAGDGATRTMRLTKGPLFDEQGALTGIFTVAVDLTAQLAADEHIRRQDTRFRALVEHSSDLVSVFSPDGTLIYSSPAAARVWGTDAEGGCPNPFDFVHPEDRPRVEATFARLLQDGPGHTHTAEVRVRRPDGAFTVLECVATNSVSDPAIGGIIVNSRDVTERKRLEEQLHYAQKLEAIGRVAGGIAHDFNNMLLVIQGNSEVVLQSEVAPDVRAAIEEIVEASDRAAQLTRQLLAFGRRKPSEPKPDDLNHAVMSLAGMLRRLIGEHIALTVRLCEEPCLVRIDRGEVEQVVLNLALNARDAMPEGGTLTIETRRDPALPVVTLVVRDTGSGMDAETARHIFEPFFSTKEEYGTGLGLATVFRIAAQHRAAIDVDTAPGRGTAISVVFPLETMLTAGERSRDVALAATGDETVLLVEDEELVRRLAQRALAGKGYRVLEAASGEDALRRYGSTADAIDLLLTDVVMPGMNGRVLAERLAADRPLLKVAYMSGYVDLPALQNVAWDETTFIQKPFRTEALARFVRTALDRDGASESAAPDSVS
jgi:two-component system cell cycle sensor histidine kinase/response regulator CckA